MLSVNYSSLKLIKAQDTKIVIDYKDNSQKLHHSAKTPVIFATKNESSSDLTFSYRIFDKNSLMLASNEVNISKSLLFFNPKNLNTKDLLNFVTKNKFPECELTLDAGIVLSENQIRNIENTQNEINSKIGNFNKDNENISKKKKFSLMLIRDFFLNCFSCYQSQSSTEND